MLVTSGRGFAWNGSTLTDISDEGFPGADWVEYLDGYYIVGVPETGKFAFSSIRDPRTWDALDFTSAERKPDDQVAGIVCGEELWIFGTESYDVFYDNGAGDGPIVRVPNGFGDTGIL